MTVEHQSTVPSLPTQTRQRRSRLAAAGNSGPTTGNIVTGSITAADLGSDSVDTVEIVNGAVTNDKLHSQAVSGSGGAGGPGTNNIEG